MADKFKFKKGGATVNPPSSTSKFTKPTTKKTPKQASQQSSSNNAKFRNNYDDDDDDDDDDGSHEQSPSTSSASSSSKLSSRTPSTSKKGDESSRKRKRSQVSDDSDDEGTAMHHGSSKKSSVMRKGKQEAKKTYPRTRGGSNDSDDDDDDDVVVGSDGPDDHDDDDHGDDDDDGKDDDHEGLKHRRSHNVSERPRKQQRETPAKETHDMAADLKAEIADLKAQLKREQESKDRAQKGLEKNREKFNSALEKTEKGDCKFLIKSYEESVKRHTQNIAVLNSQITTLTAELKALSREARAAAAAAAAATEARAAATAAAAAAPFPKGDLAAFKAFLDSQGFKLRENRTLPFNGIRPSQRLPSYQGRSESIAHALQTLVQDYEYFIRKTDTARPVRLEVVYGSPGSGKTAFASVMASFGKHLNGQAEFEAGRKVVTKSAEQEAIIRNLMKRMFGVYITFNDMMNIENVLPPQRLDQALAHLEYVKRILWSHFCGNYVENPSYQTFCSMLQESFGLQGLKVTDATDLVVADIMTIRGNNNPKDSIILYLCVDELRKLTNMCQGEEEAHKLLVALSILGKPLVLRGVFHLVTSLADPETSLGRHWSASNERDVAKNFLSALTLPQLEVIVKKFLRQKGLQLTQHSLAHLYNALAMTGGVPRLVEKVLLCVKSSHVSESVWGSAAALTAIPYIPLNPNFDSNLKAYALMTLCLSRRTGTALDAYKRAQDGLIQSGAMTMLDSETVAAIVPGVLNEWLAHDTKFTHLPLAESFGRIFQPSHNYSGIPLEDATVAVLHLAVAIKAVWCNSIQISKIFPGVDTPNWWTSAGFLTTKHEEWDLMQLLGCTSPSISFFVSNHLTHLQSSQAWTVPLGTFSTLEEKIIDSSEYIGVLDARKAAVYKFGRTFPGVDVVATIPCATSGQAIHVAFQCKLGTQANLDAKTIAGSLLATLSRPVSKNQASSLPLLDSFLASSFAFVFLAYVDPLIQFEAGVQARSAWKIGKVRKFVSPTVVAENLLDLVRNVNGLPRSERAAAKRLAHLSQEELIYLVSSCYVFMLPSHFDLLLTPTGAASFSRTRFDFRVDLAQQSGSGTSQLSSS